MKKFLAMFLVLALALGVFAGCGKTEAPVQSSEAVEESVEISEESSEPVEKTDIRFGVLKGPTGMGAAYLMEQNENGEALNNYTFTMASAPTDLVAEFAAGNLDIACLPTNVASSLYNKLNGGISIGAINTKGVLYIASTDESVTSLADLNGKTIYTTGQGANPEYVLNYIIENNDLDLTVEFLDSDELTTKAASGEVDLIMLPVPNLTTVMVKNPEMHIVVDINEEWSKITGTTLCMGCVVVNNEFYANNTEAVENFLKEYEQSINYINENSEDASALCEKFEIVGSAAIALKAIPDAAITYIEGDEVKNNLEVYYNVLFEANPQSIGGSVPTEEFYSVK